MGARQMEDLKKAYLNNKKMLETRNQRVATQRLEESKVSFLRRLLDEMNMLFFG